MAALSKVRHRLAAARTALLGLRVEYKGRQSRAALDGIIGGLEGLMDYADDAFDDQRATAAAVHWCASPQAADVERWVEAFEAWARGDGAPEQALKRNGLDYVNPRVAEMWEVWLAAMTSRALPRRQAGGAQ